MIGNLSEQMRNVQNASGFQQFLLIAGMINDCFSSSSTPLGLFSLSGAVLYIYYSQQNCSLRVLKDVLLNKTVLQYVWCKLCFSLKLLCCKVLLIRTVLSVLQGIILSETVLSVLQGFFFIITVLL